MTFIPNELSSTSADGINSYGATAGALWSGNVFTGAGEQNDFNYVAVNLQVDEAGTLTLQFSQDGTNWSSYPTTQFTVASGINEVHGAWKGTRYVRPVFTGSTGARSYFRMRTMYSYDPVRLSAPLNQSIGADSDSTIVKAIIAGKTDGGGYLDTPVTQEGHLEVAIHGPLNPFGSIHTESLTPVIQLDAVYGVNSLAVKPTIGIGLGATSGGGTAGATNASYFVSTGTNLYSQAALQSRKRIRYRPGQGIVGRFTALFSTPIPYNYQVAGFGHPEDGVYFGYKDIVGATAPEFGILYVSRGKREIQTLTVTTASTTDENITVNLGTSLGATNSNSVAVTNSGNIQRTVWEIAQGTYKGWNAYVGATNQVVFLASAVGNVTGTFSISASTAAGSFAETRAGATATELFYPQSGWNGDRLDGSGNVATNASGITLDPTKGNVYQMGIQYLGYGAITFHVETTTEDSNNATLTTVHTLNLPNTLSQTSFRNPSFPFTMAAYSAGSTASVTLQCASVGGFIEGEVITTGGRFTYENIRNNYFTSGATKPFFTILNSLTYNGEASQVVINLRSIAASITDNASAATVLIIKNGSLTGNPSFSTYSSTSSTLIDTSATGVSYTDANQVVFSIPIGVNNNETSSFEDLITLQPGEWLSVCGRSDSATINYASVSLNTREDQ